MSAVKDYLDWRRLEHVGCLFARVMSSHPENFGQVVEEIAGNDPVNLAATIAARINVHVAEEKTVAAALVLPGVTDLRTLAEMTLALSRHPGWTVETRRHDPPPQADLVAVALMRELPFGEETRPSEALVLGDFDVFPPTRRAPVTAVELFVGPPLPQDPKTHEPTTWANLAHIDLLDRDIVNVDFTPEMIDKMYERSASGRLNSLGGVEDKRAKGKVGFVIPGALAEELGCAP